MNNQDSGTYVPRLGTEIPKAKRKKNVREIFENGFARVLRMECDGYGKKKAVAAAAERTDRSVGNWLNGVRKPCFTDVIMLARKFPASIGTWLYAMTHAKEHDLERLNAELLSLGHQLVSAERRFAQSLALEPGKKPSFRRTALAALKTAGKAARHPIRTIKARRQRAQEAV